MLVGPPVELNDQGDDFAKVMALAADRAADILLRGRTWSLDRCVAALWHGARQAFDRPGARREPTWDYKINAE